MWFFPQARLGLAEEHLRLGKGLSMPTTISTGTPAGENGIIGGFTNDGRRAYGGSVNTSNEKY